MTSYLRVVWIIVQRSRRSKMDELFESAMSEKDDKLKYSIAERIEEEVRTELHDIATANKEREEEKRSLVDKLAQLKIRLNKTKNVKNPSKITLNAEISKKRAVLRKEIEEIKDKLYNIELEEKGSNITSEKLMSADR